MPLKLHFIAHLREKFVKWKEDHEELLRCIPIPYLPDYENIRNKSIPLLPHICTVDVIMTSSDARAGLIIDPDGIRTNGKDTYVSVNKHELEAILRNIPEDEITFMTIENGPLVLVPITDYEPYAIALTPIDDDEDEKEEESI